MSEPTPPESYPFQLYSPSEVFIVRPPRRRYWLHLLLFLATLFTTLVVGARLEYNFNNALPAFSTEDDALPLFPVRWALQEPSRLLLGIPFSAILLLILLSHEMGHFVYCFRSGVYATLPFFIPAPTLIGTLGAFIRIRSPIRSRAALFDIGIAGPIAGFVVAIVALTFALTLSKPIPAGMAASNIEFGYPLIFHLVYGILAGLGGAGGVSLDAAYLHPTAIAAWVGMFATALNLLPGGQLDGGHIVFAVSPGAHRWVSRGTVLILLPMGIFLWAGWLVWGFLLMLSGMRHPQVPVWPGIGPGRRLLALVALLMLLLTFMPAPFHLAGLWQGR